MSLRSAPATLPTARLRLELPRVDHAAVVMESVERVEAYCDVRNGRSIRFAEQLGMRREGVARSSSRDPQGELCDEQVLARLRDDVSSP